MRLLVLFLGLLNLVSCGQNAHIESRNLGETNFGSDVSDVIYLAASKHYHPSINFDDILTLNETKTVSLPREIVTTHGNAGNYYSLLTLDKVTCFYKGGSNFSYPLQMGNATEVVKGQKYTFKFCKDDKGNMVDLEPTDTIQVSVSIGLSIHNGDSTESTYVELELNVI